MRMVLRIEIHETEDDPHYEDDHPLGAGSATELSEARLKQLNAHPSMWLTELGILVLKVSQALEKQALERENAS